jgi:hypothetical protein
MGTAFLILAVAIILLAIASATNRPGWPPLLWIAVVLVGILELLRALPVGR